MTTQVATKVVSSGSAFPELLRRSRFASFDPTIRQSYGTPPSHLHRGNWGLKRPIAQRKRNAFISLKNFEEHEHYIEWSNAESQVRLINRIEELNVTPKLVPQVPWFVGLGPAASTPWSMMDSDFCPGESGNMSSLPKSTPAFTTDLSGLGLRGKGEYGMKPSAKSGHFKADDGYLHPNLHAMPPRVFNRYLKQLRSLRPEFKKFLKENGVSTSIRETGVPPGNLHIRFLGQHFEKQFHVPPPATEMHPNQTQPIRQQPHRLGGLMYASPTCLESFFTTGAQPGIVLETGSQQNYSSPEEANSYLISTAGFIGKLDKRKAGLDINPAFSARSGGIAHPPAALLAGQTPGNTFINVRVVDLHLERLPEAVTAYPSANSSKEVNIRMELAVHPSPNDHSRTNTHPPGSMRYIAPEDSHQKHPMTTFTHRFLDNRYIKHLYPRNPVNRLHGQSDAAALTGNFERNATLLKLNSLSNNSSKRPEQAESPFGISWNRRPRKRNWQDDQWLEGPDPDKNDGSV